MSFRIKYSNNRNGHKLNKDMNKVQRGPKNIFNQLTESNGLLIINLSLKVLNQR